MFKIKNEHFIHIILKTMTAKRNIMFNSLFFKIISTNLFYTFF